MSISDLNYKNKYLKYKNKYLNLKSQIGGVDYIPGDLTSLILMSSKSSPLNNETKQLMKVDTESSLQRKIENPPFKKPPLNKLFSTGTYIAINEPLNYREILLLAKLFISDIDNLSTEFISSNYISKNIKFSLIVLKEVLLNPTNILVLSATEYNLEPVAGPINRLYIHFNDEPQRDNYVDFQLNFIFTCFYIRERKGDIRLVLDEIKLEEFENSFNTVILGLKKNIPITVLSLKINDNGTKKIAEALKINRTITRLDLNNNKISNDGTKVLAEALKINTKLETITLYHNNIGDDGAIAIAEALEQHITLKTIWLNMNKISDKGAKALAEALKTNKTLILFNISNNNIGYDGGIAIADALKINTTLLDLNLSENKINDGAVYIADALKINTTLLNLNLQQNYIKNNGAVKIAEALIVNKTLLDLNLCGNNIRYGVIPIANALEKNTTLTNLNLSINDITIDEEIAIHIANALGRNTTLLNLNLGGNRLRNNGVTPIVTALKINNTLLYINLDENNLTASYKATLIEYLKTNTRLTIKF
jgi:Ran GTPase-activating protein (RanGAP) involved in mRNA processing and transport